MISSLKNKRFLILIIAVAFLSSCFFKPTPGTVIILIGTSSVGKTSLINELKPLLNNYEIVDIDSFTTSYLTTHPMPEQPENLDEKTKKEFGQHYTKQLAENFYTLIRNKALQGYNVLVDTVPILESDLEYKIISQSLKNIKNISMVLYCPLDITMARVQQRNLTGIPEEQRNIALPFGQYLLLYKPQDSPNEPVVETLSSSATKQVLKSAIKLFMDDLPEELKNNPQIAAESSEHFYKDFVQQFKLDQLSTISVVPKMPYDLILNCKNTPQDLAKEVMQFLEKSITTIHSFNDVNFDTFTKNDLVIFDVDETLIQPKDAFVLNEQTPQADAFRKKLLQKYPTVTIKEWENIGSLLLLQAERPLLEPSVITKIDTLQKRGIPVIACTGMNTGTLGLVPSMEAWRYNHLKSLGFEGSFNKTELTFKTFKRKPVFYHGILAADTEPKGPVVGAFLDAMQLHPKKIIMFDDTLEFLESMQAECKKRGIAFQGYEYKGAHEKPWDEKLFEQQADYLIKHKTWRSDEAFQGASI
ncbi:MAG: DUF2608 domain-containing protein [Candidatus Babeliales bacterium]